MEWTEIISQVMANQGFAIILATATLMSFAHLRNAHISDVLRKVIHELNYELPSVSASDPAWAKQHRQNLKSQIKNFKDRYSSTGAIFSLLSLSLVFLMISVILGSAGLSLGSTESAQPETLALRWVSVVFAALWLIMVTFALVLAAREFQKGPETLNLQTEELRKSFSHNTEEKGNYT